MAKLGKRRGAQQGGGKKGTKGGRATGESSSAGGSGKFERDSFFERDGGATKKRRRRAGDEEVFSSEDDDEGAEAGLGRGGSDDEDVVEDQENAETADEKRLRVARAYLDKIRDSTVLDEDENDAEETEDGKRGARDSLVADLLKQQQLEDSGRIQRKLASRVITPSSPAEGRNVSRRHRQTVTAVTLTEDDSRGFSVSKDGLLVHWDIESGQSVKYGWPTPEASTSGSGGGGGANSHSKRKPKKLGSKHILALAVSSDGRYLAAGGLDRSVHLWDTRTQEHIQAFPGHKGAISSLVFRQGTQQLMSGSFDRTIKLWSVEDRSYIDTLYGHQSEVLAIDCLRQERILSAGRDRTLRVWKVPEETQLVFRGHAASMDCCCFLSNAEFLSGSDDGSLALWNTIRKKPVSLVKNAHGSLSPLEAGEDDSSDDGKPEEERGPDTVANGHHANGNGNEEKMPSAPVNTAGAAGGGAAESWIGAVAGCRGSDLLASGAGDGMVRLWALEETNRSLRALLSLPVKGFVNSLAFAHSGRFILAGVGQEPRLGRWGRIPNVRNGVVQHMISLAD